VTRTLLLTAFLLAFSASLAQQSPTPPNPGESPSVTFKSQTGLVLLSFHVTKGKNHVANLKPSDVILLQDGKPRDFTFFDSPATQSRLPLELVLLFDDNPKIDYFWDPEYVFRFIPQWDDKMSRAILAKESADMRISVYRCFEKSLYRLSPATNDPQRLTGAFRRILLPAPPPDLDLIPLSLPERRRHVDPGPFTNDYPTSAFISAEARGWPMEAAIGALNDVASAHDSVSRILVMFSEGIGATTTVPEDVGNQALDLGIPIYPVVTNYRHHIRFGFPRNVYRMKQFAALGKMTGGREMDYPEVDAAALRTILESIRADGLSQYTVGFVPPSEGAAQTEHRLEIRLASQSSGALEGGLRRATY
jgi:hypothetical protein